LSLHVEIIERNALPYIAMLKQCVPHRAVIDRSVSVLWNAFLEQIAAFLSESAIAAFPVQFRNIGDLGEVSA
jgi:hypothetical protein